MFTLVVSHGVRIVDGGGHLWAVVEFVIMGSDVVGARCCSRWCCSGVSHGAHVMAGGCLWVIVVVVVSDGWCVVIVCCALFHGHCDHLWPFVFMGVIVCGRCGWLSLFAVWAVVLSHRVS